MMRVIEKVLLDCVKELYESFKINSVYFISHLWYNYTFAPYEQTKIVKIDIWIKCQDYLIIHTCGPGRLHIQQNNNNKFWRKKEIVVVGKMEKNLGFCKCSVMFSDT